MTVMMVRDPSDKGLPTFSKCPTTDSYDGQSYNDGPSCLTVMMVRDPSFRVLSIYID